MSVNTQHDGGVTDREKTCSPNVGLMLGQRRRRWANIGPTLHEFLVFGRTWCTRISLQILPITWSGMILCAEGVTSGYNMF